MAMTANTPTPELEPVAWENEFGELSHHKPSINPSPLYDAAAIASLTAERDAWKEPPLTCPAIEAFVAKYNPDDDLVKELDHIRDINSQLRYGLWHEQARAETAEASNRLLSDRVAVLEKERDELADQAQQYMDVSKEYISESDYNMNGLLGEADAALHVTLYDLRRARSVREAK